MNRKGLANGCPREGLTEVELELFDTKRRQTVNGEKGTEKRNTAATGD
ncbi:MAG: hypothetical protein GY757_38360 [bacterium]|nr:hypothetical protein [bacterium]